MPQGAIFGPLAKPAVAGLVWWEAVRQAFPPCSAAQNPQNTIEYFAVITAGATLAVATARRQGQERTDDSPLCIGEFITTTVCHALSIATCF